MGGTSEELRATSARATTSEAERARLSEVSNAAVSLAFALVHACVDNPHSLHPSPCIGVRCLPALGVWMWESEEGSAEGLGAALRSVCVQPCS